jgi:hypothetical protein
VIPVVVDGPATEPYTPEDPAEFAAWRLQDIYALPLLEVRPEGWTLVQLEPRPQPHQLGAWARAAAAVFEHVARIGGQLALAQVVATDNPAVHPEFFIATYRRLDD